ncbi:MAG: cyclic nucleotide-binding domain-containing protein [Anaerolineales bacterium]|nr:cyclic nucleotide-binding domain-containing protein [Anaerolineales bacterium]
MDPKAILKHVELFEGLTADELDMLAEVCVERIYPTDEIITQQGEVGEELFVVYEGFVEVVRAGLVPENAPRTIVHLGEGQIFGEMALVDRGPRSATVKAASDQTRILVIKRDDFDRICETNHHIGYVVMRNIAADLSFKLRHHHLTGR